MSAPKAPSGSYVALCGGIGGAKLALGLAKTLPPDKLTVVVNTGDDFELLGLHISPDIDTMLYTLAGLANREQGWGLEGETWGFMEALGPLNGPTWFRLGDRDLATHVLRTHMLKDRLKLSAVTRELAGRLGVKPAVVPMSDNPVATLVDTDEGALAFQDYFVRRQCKPRVRSIRFVGAETAVPAPAVHAALAAPDLAGIIVCPSNPWLSIDPMLAIPSLRTALLERRAPAVAVSPLVGGEAVKGPTAKIMRELGVALTQASIASHYHGLLDGLMLDLVDASEANTLGIPVEVTATVMQSLEDRMALAEAAIAFCARLREAASENTL